jgi:plastocyanin
MKAHTMKILYAFTLLIFLSLSCSKADDSYSGGTGGTISPVSILTMSYSPSPLTVKVGTVVRWTNTDVTAHTVTSNDGISFSSGNIPAGGVYNLLTATTGNFPYYCTIHGMAMSGTLIVTP